MKKSITLFLAALALGIAAATAQNNTENKAPTKPIAPSDNPNYTFTYDIDEVQKIIFDRLDNPNAKNEYVKVVTTDTTFPAPKGFSESAKAQFRKDVRAWIEANPGKIEKLLSEKKKYEQSQK